MKKTATMLEYEIGISAIIANFLCMWKSRMPPLKMIGGSLESP